MKKHQIGGIPVITESNDLVGIVTNRDMRFQKDHSLSLKDVMTKNPQLVSEKTLVGEALNIMNSKKITSLLVVSDKDFIPKIDLSDVLTYGINSPQSFDTLKEIKKASEEVGFFIVINHGITNSSIKKILSNCKNFLNSTSLQMRQ